MKKTKISVDAEDRILQILKNGAKKPSEILPAFTLNRQSLHLYLKKLLKQKKIKKIGRMPHVRYATTTGEQESRIHEFYTIFEEEILPAWKKKYRTLHHSLQRLISSKKRPLALGFMLESAVVYSSNIEGNTLDLSAFLNSQNAPLRHRPKEVREIDDLLHAYRIAQEASLTERSFLHCHAILSRSFVARTRQGKYREETVGVFSAQGLTYLAVEPMYVADEMHMLFNIIRKELPRHRAQRTTIAFASWCHLMIALIHPFSDGNGRIARLLEKWILSDVYGPNAFVTPTEEYYWHHREQYYRALQLGVNFWEVDFHRAHQFHTLLAHALQSRRST